MTKSDTIAEIMRINPSVGATFLSEFTNDQLARYLRRLRELYEPSYGEAGSLPLRPTSSLSRLEALQSA